MLVVSLSCGCRSLSRTGHSMGAFAGIVAGPGAVERKYGETQK
jgi:hypothetical protein